jgi:hypothetical protein
MITGRHPENSRSHFSPRKFRFLLSARLPPLRSERRRGQTFLIIEINALRAVSPSITRRSRFPDFTAAYNDLIVFEIGIRVAKDSVFPRYFKAMEFVAVFRH